MKPGFLDKLILLHETRIFNQFRQAMNWKGAFITSQLLDLIYDYDDIVLTTFDIICTIFITSI